MGLYLGGLKTGEGGGLKVGFYGMLIIIITNTTTLFSYHYGHDVSFKWNTEEVTFRKTTRLH